MEAINAWLRTTQHRPLLAILKGLRNGAMYGVKIRAPHALVMTLLFKRGPVMQMAKAIAWATYTHAKNLASFVFIYKGLMLLQEKVVGHAASSHAFIAAVVGGYNVFGQNNPINMQINLYLLSRITLGLARLAVERGAVPTPSGDPFPIFAALVWGIVLWLFEHEKHTLQPSLQSSMTYLYHDSNVFSSLRTWLWHNK